MNKILDSQLSETEFDNVKFELSDKSIRMKRVSLSHKSYQGFQNSLKNFHCNLSNSEVVHNSCISEYSKAVHDNMRAQVRASLDHMSETSKTNIQFGKWNVFLDQKI